MTLPTKFSCPCGRTLSLYSIAGHYKSKIHQDLMELKKELHNSRVCNQELKCLLGKGTTKS